MRETRCHYRGLHFGHWVVVVRNAHFSALQGGRRTPSTHSLVRCDRCGGLWRTPAAYVARLPDAKDAR